MDAATKVVRQHYEAGVGDESLLDRVRDAIDGLESGPAGDKQLAAFDHFHAGGPKATAELARMVDVQRGAKVLDAGCGLGGPSRFLARTFDCTVAGLDLSLPS